MPLFDDDENEMESLPLRTKSSASPLPWIIVGLLFIVAAGAGGVWYVNQPKKDTPTKVVAAKSNKDSVEPDEKVGSPPTKPTTPRKKSIDDPPTKIDAGPEKKDDESKTEEPDFTAPAVYRGHKGTVLSVAISRDAKTFLTTSDDRDVPAAFDRKENVFSPVQTALGRRGRRPVRKRQTCDFLRRRLDSRFRHGKRSHYKHAGESSRRHYLRGADQAWEIHSQRRHGWNPSPMECRGAEKRERIHRRWQRAYYIISGFARRGVGWPSARAMARSQFATD